MVTRISESIPAAALAAPSAGARTESLHVLRVECEGQNDGQLSALLLHEASRLHESRDDLAAAARDALAATKAESTFVEPIEALIGIAIRSRSKGNLSKLFSRLDKLASSPEQKLQASLGYIQTQIANNQLAEAKAHVLAALQDLPDSVELWLILEELAASDQDPQLLLRATLGRAAHSRSAELRSLLLERAARLQFEADEPEAAFGSFAQGFDEVPTWRALRAWEARSITDQNFPQAKEAAAKTAALILAALDEPDEATLYQIPAQELRIERAISARLRAVIYAAYGGEWSEAEQLLSRTAEGAAFSHLISVLKAELSARAGSDHAQVEAFRNILKTQVKTLAEGSPLETSERRSEFPASGQRALTDDELVYALTFLSIAARHSGDVDLEQRANTTLLDREGAGWVGTILGWQEIERDQRPTTELWDTLERQLDLDASNWFGVRSTHAAGHKQKLAETRAFSAIFSTGPDQAASTESNSQTSQIYQHALAQLENTWAAADALSAPSARTEIHRSHLRRLVARLRRDLPGEVLALRALFSGAKSEPVAEEHKLKAEAADLLRTLVLGQVSGTRPITDADVQLLTRELDDPWIPVALRTIVGGELGPEIESFCATTQPSAASDLDWARALDVLRLSSSGPATEHKHRANLTPEHDPFVIGIRLGMASRSEHATETEPTATASEAEVAALTEAIKHITDLELKSGWQLRLGLHQLRAGKNSRPAFGELLQLAKNNPAAVAELEPWLACLSCSTDPAEVFSLRSLAFKNADGSDHPALSRIDDLCLTARFRPRQLAEMLARLSREIPELKSSTEARVLDLAIALWDASSSARKHLFGYDAGAAELGLNEETSALNTSQQCLLLAAADDLTPDEELAFRCHFAELRPSNVANLGVWTLARRAGNERQRHSAIWRMARRVGSAALAAYAEQDQLSSSECEARRQFLENSLHDQTLSTVEREYLGLTLFQNRQNNITDAQALEELAATFSAVRSDSEMESDHEPDADAQLALLCAGYSYAQAEQFESALACFEPLVDHLGSDPALCLGLRVVAEKTGRADLEAACIVELARTTLAQVQACELWQQAGVLYQDQLNNEKLAEECFAEAHSHCPGNALSFERLYRLAKRRGDRSRQVELLDARLFTAESDDLRVELLWENARYCRMLGRREAALRALIELLSFEPQHLPSLALLAELHLVEERWDQAADALRAVALHPLAGQHERQSAGMYAADLFEKLQQPQAAVVLLDALQHPDSLKREDLEINGSNDPSLNSLSILERKARALARTSEWDAAFEAYAELNDRHNEIPERLEAAQMMLAIQRDQLKNLDQLKESVRRVLRDAPTDVDAIQLALKHGLSSDDRRHLLATARQDSRNRLRHNPLNPSEIELFARLCHDCGDDELERVALGILSLLGGPSAAASERLLQMSNAQVSWPTQPFTAADLERIVPSALLTRAGQFLSLLTPTFTAELEAALEVRGTLLREDEFSESPIRAEVSTWASTFGLNQFELFVGGAEQQLISGLNLDLPTLIVAKDLDAPFFERSRAQLASLMLPLSHGAAIVTSQPLEVIQTWLNAAITLIRRDSDPSELNDLPNESTLKDDQPDDHIVMRLDELLDHDLRQQLSDCYRAAQELGQATSQLPHEVLKAGLRAAALAQGDPSVVRVLPEFLPSAEIERTKLMADLIQFCLSDDFFELRRKVGLTARE